MEATELTSEAFEPSSRRSSRAALPMFPAAHDVGPPSDFPVSRAQAQLWIASQADSDGDAYVISLSLRLRGPLRLPDLRLSLAALCARHESLRTRFIDRRGELRQVVDPPYAPSLCVTDFAAAAKPAAECRAFLRSELTVPFDLARGPLWRVHLCRLGDDDHVLALLVHHIIADAW